MNTRASNRLLRPTPTPMVDGPIDVLYLIDSLGYGGAETLLVRYLERVPDLGVHPRVVVIQERDGNPLARPIEDAGIPISLLGIGHLRDRGALGAVKAAIADADPDIVHTQLEFSNILGTTAAHQLGLPSISTLHTLDRPPRWSRDAVRLRLMSWLLLRRAASVVAVSDSAGRHFAGRSGAARGLVTTIHNGIDLKPFTAPVDRTAVRDSLGVPGDAALVLTVAVLRPAKGIGDMLHAMRHALEHIPSAHYLIVGDGPDRARLEALAADLGVAERVTFAGHRDDVPSLLGAADLFVLPSHTEALPTVLMEAMAAGLPVVATEVGGIPEMVERGVSAHLVPAESPRLLADAVTRVLAAPLQAAAMGKAGRRLALDRFDIDRQAARLVAEYRRVVAMGMRP